MNQAILREPVQMTDELRLSLYHNFTMELGCVETKAVRGTSSRHKALVAMRISGHFQQNPLPTTPRPSP